MKLIQLTRLGDKPVFVNVAHIMAVDVVEPEEGGEVLEAETMLTYNSPDEAIFVKEPAEEVARMMVQGPYVGDVQPDLIPGMVLAGDAMYALLSKMLEGGDLRDPDRVAAACAAWAGATLTKK